MNTTDNPIEESVQAQALAQFRKTIEQAYVHNDPQALQELEQISLITADKIVEQHKFEGVDHDALVAAGRNAAGEAVRQYRLDNGTPFPTFVTAHIRTALAQQLPPQQ